MSRTMEPILEHMPSHIKRRIFERLENIDKCRCRRVSKTIKSAVEETSLTVDHFSFTVKENEISRTVDFTGRKYTVHGLDCFVEDYEFDLDASFLRSELRRVKGWKNAHFAVDDFKKFIEIWPRVQMKRLDICYGGSKNKTFTPLKKLFLAQFNKMIPDGSLSVQSLEVDNDVTNAELKMILMKMKKLETLELPHSNHNIHPLLQHRRRVMKGFVDLEVFKHLRVFKNEFQTVKGLDWKKLLHLDEFIIAAEDVSFEDVEILKKECLQKHHKKFEIKASFYIEDFKSSLEPTFKEYEKLIFPTAEYNVQFEYTSSSIRFECIPIEG